MSVHGPGQRSLTAAVYNAPPAVAKAVAASLRKAGHSVVHEGILVDKGRQPPLIGARTDVDLWIVKWTKDLTGAFLREFHPKLGIITISSGKGHVDEEAVNSLGLKYENCPTYGSNSVAEHAMALMFRGLYGDCVLPDLDSGKVFFSHFSDDYAERAVAQILMRARQLNQAAERAKRYDYARLDEPWTNEELSSARVGIVGRDRTSVKLARMLHDGFGCDLYGFDSSESLAFYNVKPRPLLDLLDFCDYVFMCTDRYGFQVPQDAVKESFSKGVADSRHLPESEIQFFDSSVAVLGTGGIGSIIARIALKGFRCGVTAYSRSEREHLSSEGVVYHVPQKDPLALRKAVDDAAFIFISAKLPKGSPPLIDEGLVRALPVKGPRIVVNVARDDMVASDPMYRMLSEGSVYCYATDVLPNDAILWDGGKPDEMTIKFVQHQSVVATPHEGDASRRSLARLRAELMQAVEGMLS